MRASRKVVLARVQLRGNIVHDEVEILQRPDHFVLQRSMWQLLEAELKAKLEGDSC